MILRVFVLLLSTISQITISSSSSNITLPTVDFSTNITHHKTNENVSSIELKSRRRIGYKSPTPFAKYLKSAKERQELIRVIKTARIEGASRTEVASRIDNYLRAHLDATDFAEIEQLRTEGKKLNQNLLNSRFREEKSAEFTSTTRKPRIIT